MVSSTPSVKDVTTQVDRLALQCVRTVEVIDSHTEGNPTRVVVGGVTTPHGESVLQRQRWVVEHDDELRRLLNFEPRGNPMMCSVLLMPPVSLGTDYSVLLMEQDEYVPMCGHCIIGAATTVVSARMVAIHEPYTKVTFETVAGIVECQVEVSQRLVGGVTLNNVESFLLHRDQLLEVPDLGRLTVDIAFGGDFYVIVDADQLGLSLRPDNHPALERAAKAIISTLQKAVEIRHPERPYISGCYETLFTTRFVETGDVKQTVVSPPGALDRSPCGTGTCARLAAMFARGLVDLQQDVVFEGVLGTCFTARVLASDDRKGFTFIRPALRGRAYITSVSTVVLQAEDPFPQGYRIGPKPRDQGSSSSR
jgi:proline racemase